LDRPGTRICLLAPQNNCYKTLANLSCTASNRIDFLYTKDARNSLWYYKKSYFVSGFSFLFPDLDLNNIMTFNVGGKTEGGRHLGTQTKRGKDNIKTDLGKM
jgi:hypothetical protein